MHCRHEISIWFGPTNCSGTARSHGERSADRVSRGGGRSGGGAGSWVISVVALVGPEYRTAGGALQVYALDLPGFGENRSPGLLQLDQTAAWLCAWMDAIGLQRTHLIGHSMGGFIVGQVAAADPHRVDRLVLVDAVVRPYARPYWGPVANLWAEMRHTPLAFVPTLVNDAARAGLWTLHRATRAVVRADSRPRLTGITAPTLVIWGAQDSLVAPVDADELVRAIPDCELVVIEGAGHNPMWDRADEFNALVLEFLRRDVVQLSRREES